MTGSSKGPAPWLCHRECTSFGSRGAELPAILSGAPDSRASAAATTTRLLTRRDQAAYKPELTQVFQRWKGDRSSVLQQILESSKVIEDRYRSVNFELKDGDELTGIMVPIV